MQIFTCRDGNVPGATFQLSGSGELDISRPAFTAFHHFRLTLGRLDLRTLQYVLPEFRVSTASSRVWRHSTQCGGTCASRNARISHIDGDAPVRVTGNGRYTLGDVESTYDMTLEGAPISFTALARSYPSLPLRSEFSGPFALQGTLANLDFVAKMSGPPGGFAVEWSFDLMSPGRSASGALILSHVNAQALVANDSIPETDLTGRLNADVSGDSLATLEWADQWHPRRFIHWPPHAGYRSGRRSVRLGPIASGYAERCVSGRLLLRERWVALRAGLRDSLAVTLTADSLGGWRSYLASDSSADTTHREVLSGRLRLAGAITGWIDSLGATGTLDGTGLALNGIRARTLTGTMNVPRLRAPAAGTVNVTVGGVTAWNTPLDSMVLRARFTPDGRTLVAMTAAEPAGTHAAGALEFRRSLDTTMLTLDTLAVYTHDNAWHLARPAHFRNDQTGATLDLLCTMHGAVAGTISAEATIPQVGAVTARVRADSVPIVDLAQLLESHMDYGGLASADLRMSGDRQHPTIQGVSKLEGARFGDVRLEAVVAQIGYADQRLDLHSDLVQKGDTTLHLHLSLPADLAIESRSRRLLNDSIRGDIRADSAGFEALATMYPALENPKGTFAAAVAIGGTADHPMFNGDIRVANAEAGFPKLGVRFVGMQANLHFAGDSLAVRDVTINTVTNQRRGRAQLTGWVTSRMCTTPGTT